MTSPTARRDRVQSANPRSLAAAYLSSHSCTVWRGHPIAAGHINDRRPVVEDLQLAICGAQSRANEPADGSVSARSLAAWDGRP
jgi:hypothetical protein